MAVLDVAKYDWYEELVEDCTNIVKESIFSSNWALIEGYWELGKRICEEVNFKREETYGKKILTGLSESIGVGIRDIYRAIKLYNKYPNISKLPEGKLITWNKLVTKYLPDKAGEEVKCVHSPITVCKFCRKVL